MSFLFKSKSKNAPPPPQPPPSGLPAASRNIHTSDGTAGPPKPPLAASSPLEDRKAQSPPPNTSANGSLNSLPDQKPAAPPPQHQTQMQMQMAPPNGPQAPFARRDRAASELGVSTRMKDVSLPLLTWNSRRDHRNNTCGLRRTLTCTRGHRSRSLSPTPKRIPSPDMAQPSTRSRQKRATST